MSLEAVHQQLEDAKNSLQQGREVLASGQAVVTATYEDLAAVNKKLWEAVELLGRVADTHVPQLQGIFDQACEHFGTSEGMILQAVGDTANENALDALHITGRLADGRTQPWGEETTTDFMEMVAGSSTDMAASLKAAGQPARTALSGLQKLQEYMGDGPSKHDAMYAVDAINSYQQDLRTGRQ